MEGTVQVHERDSTLRGMYMKGIVFEGHSLYMEGTINEGDCILKGIRRGLYMKGINTGRRLTVQGGAIGQQLQSLIISTNRSPHIPSPETSAWIVHEDSPSSYTMLRVITKPSVALLSHGG